MTDPTPNRPHPGVFPQDLVWNDEPRATPAPVSSSVSAHEREAELLGGLAKRVHELREPDQLDRRLSWEQLYTMFRDGKVSKVKATQWADMITQRGVRRQ